MSYGVERPVRGVADLKPDCHPSVSYCLLPLRLQRTVMLSWEVVDLLVLSSKSSCCLLLCQIVAVFHSPAPALSDLSQLPCSCPFANEFILLLILESEWKEIVCTEVVESRSIVKHEELLRPKVKSVCHICFPAVYEQSWKCSCDYQPNSFYKYGLQGIEHSLNWGAKGCCFK